MAIERSRLVANLESLGAGDPDVIAALAVQVLVNPKIDLSRAHVSGIKDGATARQNMLSQAFENLAKRSKYENAPGGTLNLDVRVLRALLELAKAYSMSISELAGGSHSKHSTHYDGLAFDVNFINGARVSINHPDLSGFMRACRDLGAKIVIGPPAKGHDTHVHAEWSK